MRRVGDDARQQGAPLSARLMLHRIRVTASLVVVFSVVAWTALAVPAIADSAPKNISPPAILGTAQSGQTLTEAHGSWTNRPSAYSYSWQRCNNTGTGCTAIANATHGSYTVMDADIGQTIIVEEVALNDAGASAPASSAPTPVVSSAPPPSSTTTGSVTSLMASPSAPVVNGAVTLIAAVTSSDSQVAPSGVVTFLNGSTAIGGCANEPVAPSGASVLVTCQTWFAATAAQLTAVFSPSAGVTVASSASPTLSLVISPDSTSTALRVSSSVGVRASTTYTATVASTLGRLGTLQPTGTVEFFDGGEPITSCSGQPLTNGRATCTVSYDAPGSHSITAQYSGDANFHGSSAPAQPMSVLAPSTQPTSAVTPPVKALGWITSTMQWTFYSTPTYTKVLKLAVNAASAATVTTRCQGPGCPFSRRTILVTKTKLCAPTRTRPCPPTGTIDLAPAFRDRRLSVGAQITVAITRPGWIGKYYRFTLRAHRSPRVLIACLAPGSRGPGAGCKAGG